MEEDLDLLLSTTADFDRYLLSKQKPQLGVSATAIRPTPATDRRSASGGKGLKSSTSIGRNDGKHSTSSSSGIDTGRSSAVSDAKSSRTTHKKGFLANTESSKKRASTVSKDQVDDNSEQEFFTGLGSSSFIHSWKKHLASSNRPAASYSGQTNTNLALPAGTEKGQTNKVSDDSIRFLYDHKADFVGEDNDDDDLEPRQRKPPSMISKVTISAKTASGVEMPPISGTMQEEEGSPYPRPPVAAETSYKTYGSVPDRAAGSPGRGLRKMEKTYQQSYYNSYCNNISSPVNAAEFRKQGFSPNKQSAESFGHRPPLPETAETTLSMDRREDRFYLILKQRQRLLGRIFGEWRMEMKLSKGLRNAREQSLEKDHSLFLKMIVLRDWRNLTKAMIHSQVVSFILFYACIIEIFVQRWLFKRVFVRFRRSKKVI